MLGDAGFAVVICLQREALQDLVDGAWRSGLLPGYFADPVPKTIGTFKDATWELFLASPKIVLEPLHHWPTLDLELGGTLRTPTSMRRLQIRYRVRAPLYPVRSLPIKGLGAAQSLPQKSGLKLGLDLRHGESVGLELWLDGEDMSFLSVLIIPILQAELAKIPPDATMFSPPLLDQITGAGYRVGKPAVRLTEEAVILGFDATCKEADGRVTFDTNGDPTRLVDLNGTTAPRGFRTSYIQDRVVGSDGESGATLRETGYSPVLPASQGVHGTAVSIVVHESLVRHYYNRALRWEILGRFEAARAQAIHERLFLKEEGKPLGLAHFPPPTMPEELLEAELARIAQDQDPYAKVLQAMPPEVRREYVLGQLVRSRRLVSHRFELPSAARLTLNELEIWFEDGKIQVRASVTAHQAVEITTDVHMGLRVVRVDLSGSTWFVNKHAAKEGLRFDVMELVIDKPELVEVLEAFGIVLGLALAPVTYGASLVLVIGTAIADHLVEALIGRAESEARQDIQGMLAGFAPRELALLPGSPMAFQLVPEDASVDRTGLAAWFHLHRSSVAPVLRLEDPAIKSGDPRLSLPLRSTHTGALRVRLVDGETVLHPAYALARVRWRIRSATATLHQEEAPYSKKGQVDRRALRIEFTRSEPNWQALDRFVVDCVIVKPGVGGEIVLYEASLVVEVADRLLRHHPYVRWQHAVHYLGHKHYKGHPAYAPAGWVHVDRPSKIHHT
ncbi:MAG: hypothetical protein IT377_04660, partial [Polyangiaceae bacterium]|nr:hypothetical protein [Polyangiaceae bacterium]